MQLAVRLRWSLCTKNTFGAARARSLRLAKLEHAIQKMLRKNECTPIGKLHLKNRLRTIVRFTILRIHIFQNNFLKAKRRFAFRQLPLMMKEKLIRQIIFFTVSLLRNAQLQAPSHVLRPSKFFFHARKQASNLLIFRRAWAGGYTQNGLLDGNSWRLIK